MASQARWVASSTHQRHWIAVESPRARIMTQIIIRTKVRTYHTTYAISCLVAGFAKGGAIHAQRDCGGIGVGP